MDPLSEETKNELRSRYEIYVDFIYKTISKCKELEPIDLADRMKCELWYRYREDTELCLRALGYKVFTDLKGELPW
jgi:hypothetical protein